ncbi:phage integrase central domain-containing protein [Laribacter hongkongensis]
MQAASQGGKWSHDHAERILKRLEQNLFPAIGKQPIAHLTTLN